MVIFCFCWFLVLYGSTFILAKNKDVFSPVKFICLKYALLNLSFILYVCFDPNSFYKQILKVCNVTLPQAFLQYTILQTIAFVAVVAGMVVFSKKKRQVHNSAIIYNYKAAKILAVLFFATGITAYSIFLNRIGGLQFLLSNLSKRIELQGGQYILNLLPLLVLACLLLLLCIKLKNNVLDKILLTVFVIITLGIYSSFGGRENSLLFIITLIVAVNYIINQLRVNKKSIAVFFMLFLALFFYIIAIPAIRNHSNSDKHKAISQVFNIKVLVYNISYTYIDVFAANYFNKNNAWYLKGYFEPVDALFAKPDKSAIPQVDQGVYFNSIITYQKDFRPPLPRREVTKASWPTENFGFAYANFLIPGIIVFFFLQGMVFSLTYRMLVRDNFNPLLIMIYILVIFTFNFSSLRISGFIKVVPLIYLCHVLFNKFVALKNNHDSLKIKF